MEQVVLLPNTTTLEPHALTDIIIMNFTLVTPGCVNNRLQRQQESWYFLPCRP